MGIVPRPPRNYQPPHYTCSVCGQLGHNKKSHDMRVTKKCATCQIVLPASAFLPRNTGKRAYTEHARLASSCRACDVARSARRYDRDFRTRLAYLLHSAQRHAQAKGMAFDIDVAYLVQQLAQQQGRCYYTDLDMLMDHGDQAVSCERRDPTLGYIPGNVVLTCWRANNMKSRLSEADFVGLCKRVAAKHG